MGDTKIEWTEKTWNPVRGCSVVSEGCRNCYAMNFATRFAGKGEPYEGLAYRNESGAHWTGKVRLIEEHLNDPLKWRKPARVFVNSMSDLFHESLTDGQILRVFEVMLRAPQHTFQILTKRPARMKEWFTKWTDLTGESREPQMVRGPSETRIAHPSPRGQMFAEYLETLGSEPPPGCAWPTFDWMQGMRWWPTNIFERPNIWLGVSVEDQKTADERIYKLRSLPAAVRMVSYEPALGPVANGGHCADCGAHATVDGKCLCADKERLHWWIVGGESGPKARPMHPDWARSLRDQCVAAGVPFFFKQWGEWLPDEAMDVHSAEGLDQLVTCETSNRKQHQWWKGDPRNAINTGASYRIGKKSAGRLLDGREWSQYPQAQAKAVSA